MYHHFKLKFILAIALSACAVAVAGLTWTATAQGDSAAAASYVQNGDQSQFALTAESAIAESLYAEDAVLDAAAAGTPLLNAARATLAVAQSDDWGNPTDWIYCSTEGGTCSLPEGQATRVRYGANNKYSYGVFYETVSCSTTVFGDPIPHYVKQCEYLVESTSGLWIGCALENETCAAPAEATQVRFGANNTYNSRDSTGSIICNASNFGDPIPGAAKACSYYLEPVADAIVACAGEQETCSFSSSPTLVFYGADGAYNSGIFTDSVLCSSVAFGDPAPNAAKSCFFYELDKSHTALERLDRHSRGNITLTNAELYAIRDIIKQRNNYGEFAGNASLIQEAYAIIEAYEAQRGALFTPNGTFTFGLADSTTDGHALARAMHQLYLAVFDGINSDLIATNIDLVNGLAFGSHAYFPGAVPTPTDPNAIYTKQIDATVLPEWGRPTSYEGLPARRPTGAYLAPGTIGEVIVPPALVNKGFYIRVGAHSWDLSNRPVQKRLARTSNLQPILDTTTRIANPNGGNIYIEVPHLADEGIVTVRFKNTIRAPLYSATSFEQTTAAEWQIEKTHPAPVTDVESERVLLNMPSTWIRGDLDVAKLVTRRDRYVDAVMEYAGKDEVSTKPFLFDQVDVIYRGTANFPGYPQSNSNDYFRAEANRIWDPEVEFDAVTVHEMSHAVRLTTFAKGSEAEVNLPGAMLLNTVYGRSLDAAFSQSKTSYRDSFVTRVDAINSWFLTDEFVAGDDFTNEQGNYNYRAYGLYIDIVDMFGWAALIDFNREIQEEYELYGYADLPPGHNNHPTDDRILRLSRHSGIDLRPLVHLWGRQPDNQAALVADLEAEGLLPSSRIYDKMVAYKATIPQNQADFDAFWEIIGFNILDEAGWSELRANFDVARAQAAGDRVDELIDYYFPTGRPGGGLWVQCALEGDTCSLPDGPTEVRYGANGTYNTGVFTDSVACSGATFGDPVPNVIKSCEYLEGGLPLGDANCSGEVTILDALVIVQYTEAMRTDVGSCPLASPATQLNGTMGDVNQDGTVGVADALFIMQCEVGIDNLFCPSE